jgi:hypothetical protein
MRIRLFGVGALVLATLVPAGVAAAKSPFDVPPKGPPPWVTPPAGPFADTRTITSDYLCDAGGGFSPESLTLLLIRSEERAGMTVSVDGAAALAWEDILFEDINVAQVGWPADDLSNPLNRTWSDSFVVTVRGAGGEVLYEDTFTIERLLAEQPLCSVLFDD